MFSDDRGMVVGPLPPCDDVADLPHVFETPRLRHRG